MDTLYDTVITSPTETFSIHSVVVRTNTNLTRSPYNSYQVRDLDDQLYDSYIFLLQIKGLFWVHLERIILYPYHLGGLSWIVIHFFRSLDYFSSKYPLSLITNYASRTIIFLKLLTLFWIIHLTKLYHLFFSVVRYSSWGNRLIY